MKRLLLLLIAASTAICLSRSYPVLFQAYAAPIPINRDSGIQDVSIEIPQEGIYDLMLSSVTGPLTYYNQGDARWQDCLYGGLDPFPQYGCGPTVMAMVVTSMTGIAVTPPQMAQWSAEHNCWCPGQGSYHKLIPEAAKGFGLEVLSLGNCSTDRMAEMLKSGRLLVILVKPGLFTRHGHFLIITEMTPEGNFRLADSAQYDNTKIDWDPQVIHQNLNTHSTDGGPVWAIGYPPLPTAS